MARTLAVVTVNDTNATRAEEGSEQIAAGPLRFKVALVQIARRCWSQVLQPESPVIADLSSMFSTLFSVKQRLGMPRLGRVSLPAIRICRSH